MVPVSFPVAPSMMSTALLELSVTYTVLVVGSTATPVGLPPTPMKLLGPFSVLTVSSALLATYTSPLTGSAAMPNGIPPVASVPVTMFDVSSISDTSVLCSFVTYTVPLSMATPTGATPTGIVVTVYPLLADADVASPRGRPAAATSAAAPNPARAASPPDLRVPAKRTERRPIPAPPVTMSGRGTPPATDITAGHRPAALLDVTERKIAEGSRRTTHIEPGPYPFWAGVWDGMRAGVSLALEPREDRPDSF